MNAREEKAYIEGQRAAYRTLLDRCVDELLPDHGKKPAEVRIAQFIVERQEVCSGLRTLMRDMGIELEWNDKDHLGDTIEDITRELCSKVNEAQKLIAEIRAQRKSAKGPPPLTNDIVIGLRKVRDAAGVATWRAGSREYDQARLAEALAYIETLEAWFEKQ